MNLPAKTEAQKRAAQLTNMRVDRLRTEITDIANSLQQISDTDRVQIQERIFVNVMLPFFAGDEKLPFPVKLQHWVNYAGSAYREVDVVDHTGKKLFTVPALYDRSAVNPINGERTSIAHVVHSAQQYSNMHPAQGAAYLDKELSKRAVVMKVPASVLKNLKTWNEIFVRYGRPPLDAEITKPDQPGQPVAGSIETQFDDFEPL